MSARVFMSINDEPLSNSYASFCKDTDIKSLKI